MVDATPVLQNCDRFWVVFRVEMLQNQPKIKNISPKRNCFLERKHRKIKPDFKNIPKYGSNDLNNNFNNNFALAFSKTM